MSMNVGGIDRILRIVVGLALIGAAVFHLMPVWGWIGVVPLATGLIGWWKFDESTGTTASDSSGNGNTGTLTNAQETDTAAATSNTTNIVPTSGASMSSTDDAYNGMIAYITGGGGCGITTGTQRTISDYTGSSKTVIVSPAFAAEAKGIIFDLFKIGAMSADEVVERVDVSGVDELQMSIKRREIAKAEAMKEQELAKIASHAKK